MHIQYTSIFVYKCLHNIVYTFRCMWLYNEQVQIHEPNFYRPKYNHLPQPIYLSESNYSILLLFISKLNDQRNSGYPLKWHHKADRTPDAYLFIMSDNKTRLVDITITRLDWMTFSLHSVGCQIMNIHWHGSNNLVMIMGWYRN